MSKCKGCGITLQTSDKNQVGLITIQGFKIPILKSELDCYSVEYELPDAITAPIELNEPLGNVVVLYNNDVIYSDEGIEFCIKLLSDLKTSYLKWCIQNDELVSAKRAEGGFISSIRELKADETQRNTFDTDIMKYIKNNKKY